MERYRRVEVGLLETGLHRHGGRLEDLGRVGPDHVDADNAVRRAAEEYQDTLDTHLTTVDATLDLVKAQMATLYVTAADQATTTGADDQPDQDAVAEESQEEAAAADDVDD